jgi:hypothetical protein
MRRKKMANVFPDKDHVTTDAEGVVEAVRTLDVNVVGVQSSKSNAKRLGNSGRKRKEEGELPSNKLKRNAYGAESCIEYQEACKAEATAPSLLIRNQNISYRGAAKSMQAALMVKCVSVQVSTCRDQVMRAMANGYVGLDPQRNGGQALPSSIEKENALNVKHMREQFSPLFQEDVIKWAVEAIAGTDYAS